MPKDTKARIAVLALAASLVFSGQNLNCQAKTDDWKLINFDIDHSVSSQKLLSTLIDERKDLYADSNSIRLWTNAKGLRIVRSSVADLRKKYPQEKWLSFNGSGDFHQLSATLIESIPEKYRPLTIVLFDNHPDWFKAPAHYHCGAWVVQALKHKWVEKVVMVAQNSSDIRGDQFRLAPFNELCKGRVEMHPFERSKAFVPLVWPSMVKGVAGSRRSWLGTELSFDTVQKDGAEVLARNLAEKLKGKNIYLSLDKDVLNTNDAITDWDQGKLSLSDLLKITTRLNESANLVGMDICGERAPDPVHGILKKIDCGRTFKKVCDFESATQVNEKTNLCILKSVFARSPVSTELRGEVENKAVKPH